MHGSSGKKTSGKPTPNQTELTSEELELNKALALSLQEEQEKVEEREKKVEEREKNVAERERKMEEREKKMEEKEIQVTERERRVEGHDHAISAKIAALEGQTQQIFNFLQNQQQGILTGLDQKVNSLGNSQSDIFRQVSGCSSKEELHQLQQAQQAQQAQQLQQLQQLQNLQKGISTEISQLKGSIGNLDQVVTSHVQEQMNQEKEIREIMKGDRFPKPEGMAGSLSVQQCHEFQKILQLVRMQTEEVRNRHNLFLSTVDAQQTILMQMMSSASHQGSAGVPSMYPSYQKPSKSVQVGFCYEESISMVVNSVVESLGGVLFDYNLQHEEHPISRPQFSPSFSPICFFLLLRASERLDDADVQRKISSLPGYIPKCVLLMKPRANANFQEESFVKFSCTFHTVGFQQGGSSIFSSPQNDKTLSECAAFIRAISS